MYVYIEMLTGLCQESITVPKKFQNAVVYVLQCIDNYYYIGSTINNPRFRLNNHKKDSIQFPDRLVYKHINEIGWDNVQLQVVETYPCDTKEELRLKEDEMIKCSLNDEYCLNYQRASVSAEERKENIANYYLTHRDQILQQHKQYLEANKEKVDAYQSAYRKENAEDRREYSRQYAEDHPEHVKAKKKEYYESHKTEIIEKQKAYVEANREEVQRRKSEWASNNRDAMIASRKLYAEKNREVIQERGKEYYEQNKDSIKEKFKAYREANKDKMKEYAAAYRVQNRDTLSESHTCECGGKYTANHAKIHMESKRHIRYINTN